MLKYRDEVQMICISFLRMSWGPEDISSGGKKIAVKNKRTRVHSDVKVRYYAYGAELGKFQKLTDQGDSPKWWVSGWGRVSVSKRKV